MRNRYIYPKTTIKENEPKGLTPSGCLVHLPWPTLMFGHLTELVFFFRKSSFFGEKNLLVQFIKPSSCHFIIFSFHQFYQSFDIRPTYGLKLQVLYHFGEHFWCLWRGQGQKYHLQVILNDFLNVKIDWQKVAATWGYWS